MRLSSLVRWPDGRCEWVDHDEPLPTEGEFAPEVIFEVELEFEDPPAGLDLRA